MFNPEQTKEFADDILYGIQHQSLFLRIRDQSMNNFDNYRYENVYHKILKNCPVYSLL